MACQNTRGEKKKDQAVQRVAAGQHILGEVIRDDFDSGQVGAGHLQVDKVHGGRPRLAPMAAEPRPVDLFGFDGLELLRRHQGGVDDGGRRRRRRPAPIEPEIGRATTTGRRGKGGEKV
jgi:hypothetical protein